MSLSGELFNGPTRGAHKTQDFSVTVPTVHSNLTGTRCGVMCDHFPLKFSIELIKTKLKYSSPHSVKESTRMLSGFSHGLERGHSVNEWPILISGFWVAGDISHRKLLA